MLKNAIRRQTFHFKNGARPAIIVRAGAPVSLFSFCRRIGPRRPTPLHSPIPRPSAQRIEIALQLSAQRGERLHLLVADLAALRQRQLRHRDLESGHRQTIFLRKPLEVRLFDARDVCVDLALGKAIQLLLLAVDRQRIGFPDDFYRYVLLGHSLRFRYSCCRFNNAMHLSTSRTKRLTRARARSRFRPPPASPSASRTHDSSSSSERTRSCNVLFSLRRASPSVFIRSHSPRSLACSAISRRTCAARFAMIS